jgi:hypothetical protein
MNAQIFPVEVVGQNVLHPRFFSSTKAIYAVMAGLWALASCAGSNVGPGDSDYPAVNSAASQIVSVSGTVPADWQLKIVAAFRPRSNINVKTQKMDCGHSHGYGFESYAVDISLPIIRQGSTYATSFMIDHFQEGRCEWRFQSLSAEIKKREPEPISYASLAVSPVKNEWKPTNQTNQIDKWCVESSSYKERMGLSLDCDEVGGVGSMFPDQSPIEYIPWNLRGSNRPLVISENVRVLIANIHDLDAEAAIVRAKK